MIADDLSVGDAPNFIDGGRGEGALSPSGQEAAVAAMIGLTDSPLEVSAEMAQGSGVGLSIARDFKGAWVATVARDGLAKGSAIERWAKRPTKKK
eukprot:162993-Pyramimonas_sp.AAC.1